MSKKKKITKKSIVLRRFTNLYWATFKADLHHMWPVSHGLDKLAIDSTAFHHEEGMAGHIACIFHIAGHSELLVSPLGGDRLERRQI